MFLVGYEAEQMNRAELKRHFSLCMSSNASKNIFDYYIDRFQKSDEEDEDYQEEKKELEKDLAARKAAGEFDSDKMREFAKKHAEEKEKLKNGNNTR